MALDFGNKVENGGIPPNGVLPASEFNALVAQVNKNEEDIAAIDEPNSIESIEATESQASGGNNVITITETNGTETSFNVKNGTDGADGVSLGDVEIADNLTTNDNTKVLSAKQGYVLKGLIDSQTFPIVDNLEDGGHESALSAEMGKVVGDLLKVEEDYTRYEYPTIFGNYSINASALQSAVTFYCTEPFLLKAGETVTTPITVNQGRFALVDEDDLPLTESTPITRVATTGTAVAVLSYTNNTGADVWVIHSRLRDAKAIGLKITASKSEYLGMSEVLADVDEVKDAISLPKSGENLLPFSNFGHYNIGVNLSTGKMPTGIAPNQYWLTKPIPLEAGDIVHIKKNSTASVNIGILPEGTEQSSSTVYDPMWNDTIPFDENNVAEFSVSEDMQIVIAYTDGTIDEASIIPPITEMLPDGVLYPTIADDCIIENADSDVCLIMGSSLTWSGYSPKAMSWIERVNDLVDIGIVNGGHSGVNLSGNITDMTTGTINLLGVTLKTLKPRYIVSNNDANNTPTGSSLDAQLKQFERIAKSVGATCLVCGEEPTLINAQNYNKQAAMTKQGVNYYPTAMLWYNLNRTQSYRGWLDGSQQVHSNSKNGSSHVSMSEMLSQLYIHKSVKFYKVRENYKGGEPTTAQLAYADNFERAKIWRGTCPAVGATPMSWTNDNIDNSSYNIEETPNVDLLTDTTKTSEVASSKIFGEKITFYKHALVEIITPRVQVSKAQVTIECSVQPTDVGYISNGTYIALEYTYADGLITIALSGADIQDYDKIKIVVSDTTDETFTLGKVKAMLYDGESKPSYEVRYKGRKVGTELMTKTSVESGWTMAGNASVKQLPTAVRNYTSLNNVANHIQLDDDSASASYTQSLDKTVHKVAVRIAATIFPPLQTTRTTNDYTTTTQNLFRGMYYGGELLLTINNAYIPLHIEFGWTEVYAEAIIDSNSLSLSIGRATAFDSDNYNVGEFPVFIHNVSVQEIG